MPEFYGQQQQAWLAWAEGGANNPQQWLAQVIQGEARSAEGQFAVAATIYNRAQANLSQTGAFPGGTDPIAIVAAKDQFTGFSTSGYASPSAYNLAGALLGTNNTTVPDYGNVGNVTDYRGYYTPGSTLGPGEGPGDQNYFRPGINGAVALPSLGAQDAGYIAPAGGNQSDYNQDFIQDTATGNISISDPLSGGVATMPEGLNPDTPAGLYTPISYSGGQTPALETGTDTSGGLYQPGPDPGTNTGYIPAGPGQSTQLPEVTVGSSGGPSGTETAPQGTGIETGTYDGQSYTFASPGGPQSASGYQGPDANAPIAPAQTDQAAAPDVSSQPSTDNLPLMASGSSPELQAAGLGQNTADAPGWGQGLNAPGSGSFPPSLSDGAAPDAGATPGADNLPLQASGATGAQQAAGLQDQSALSSDGATAGLPGPLKQILGGQAPGSDAQAPSAKGEDSSGGAPVDITDISGAGAKGLEAASKAITGAGKTVGQSAQQLGQVAAQDTQSLVQAASKADQQAADIAQTTLSHFSNLFQRGMVAFLGLVLIGGAVYYFSKHQASAT